LKNSYSENGLFNNKCRGMCFIFMAFDEFFRMGLLNVILARHKHENHMAKLLPAESEDKHHE
jgi:hypothetical protein